MYTHFDRFFLMIYCRTLTTFYFFCHIKQIASILLCTPTDHRRPQNVVKTSVTHLAVHHEKLFLFSLLVAHWFKAPMYDFSEASNYNTMHFWWFCLYYLLLFQSWQVSNGVNILRTHQVTHTTWPRHGENGGKNLFNWHCARHKIWEHAVGGVLGTMGVARWQRSPLKWIKKKKEESNLVI